LELGAKVVAVEPQSECYKFLKKKYGSKISVEKKALGDKEETKEMYISQQTNVISSFSEDWIKAVQKSGRFKDGNWEKKELVQLTTLDKLIGVYGIPHYIKIDVEGYEYEVLRGLTHQINLISFEFTLPEQIEKTILCLEYLNKMNNNIECNYALETNKNLEWCLKQWVDVNQFREIINSFKTQHFGDAFIRMKN
jgi:FkbM family methyltransferase